ncbi:MAG: glycosyltransferase [Spirochaetota bacterium]|nr:glycosyltransferase [Spirochaetota bacterium]
MLNPSKRNITVLTSFDRISLFHTLKPFLFSNPLRRGAFHFKLMDSVDEVLGRDRNRNLLVLRLPKVRDVEPVDIMQALRVKYRRVVFYNDGAAAGTNNFEFLPYVDRFIVKSMFRDRSQYLRPLYRNRLFTDYYHRMLGVTDPDLEEPSATDGAAADAGAGTAAGVPSGAAAEVPAGAESAQGVVKPEELEKLRLGWNIGVGDFPREDLRQRAGVFTARTVHPKLARLFFRNRMPEFMDPGEMPGDHGTSDGGAAAGVGLGAGGSAAGASMQARDIPVHARLGTLPAPSVNRQREIFLGMIDGDPRFVTGRAPKKQYDGEMRRAMITLSPFGWGEVCFRDFEAVFAGTLLLKPDMSHIETWPDIYRPGETYVPLSWDGDDLLERVDYYLAHPREGEEIARNAQEVFRQAVGQMRERFNAVMEEAFG